MQIGFNEIMDGGLRVTVDDGQWFPEDLAERCADLKAQLFFQRRDTRVIVDGSIETQIKFTCDRCLEDAQLPLLIDFRLVIDLQQDDVTPGEREHCCTSGEMDVMLVDKPIIDVFALLRQQVFLALPAKRLCRDDCRGLCLHCGGNLNAGSCRCADEVGSASTFGALAALVKK